MQKRAWASISGNEGVTAPTQLSGGCAPAIEIEAELHAQLIAMLLSTSPSLTSYCTIGDAGGTRET